jgi:hypothetical protein
MLRSSPTRRSETRSSFASRSCVGSLALVVVVRIVNERIGRA